LKEKERKFEKKLNKEKNEINKLNDNYNELNNKQKDIEYQYKLMTVEKNEVQQLREQLELDKKYNNFK